MTKRKRHKSTMTRVERLKVITAAHYEPGNQARCYKAVWRRWIEPEFGVCYRTYLNLLGITPEEERESERPPIPTLFD